MELHCATGLKCAGRGSTFVAVRCVDQATIMPQEEDEEGGTSPAEPRTANTGDGGCACRVDVDGCGARRPNRRCVTAEGENGCRSAVGAREGEHGATGVCVGGGENPSWERCGLTNTVELSTAGTVAFALELTVYSKGLAYDVPVGALNSFQPSASPPRASYFPI